MNIHIFSPVLAPNNVLPFLTNLLSIASCTYLALVWAEKFKLIVDILFLYLRSVRRLPTSTDLPTPDSPVNINGFSMSNICYIILEYLSVSMVGTSKSKNCASLSNTNSGTLVFQLTNPCCVSGLMKWSNMHYALGNVISENESYIIAAIYALCKYDIPPANPQIIAYI